MKAQNLPVKILIWIPGILLAIAVLCLYVYRNSGTVWVVRVGNISFAFFLFMPTIFLIIHPDLAISLLNIVTHLLTRSSWSDKYRIAKGPLIKTQQWVHMKFEERIIIYIIVIIGLILGGLVLGNTFLPELTYTPE